LRQLPDAKAGPEMVRLERPKKTSRLSFWVFFCALRRTKGEKEMVGTQILWKNADLLSIDELVELAGYGLEWIIEDGHVTAAVLLEEAS